MVGLLISLSFLVSLAYFSYRGLSIYLQNYWQSRQAKYFLLFSSGGIILDFQFSFTFLNLSYTFLVGVLQLSEFRNLFRMSFLAFLNTLCLMIFLCWNVLSLVLFIGSRRCFLYSAITILSSLSQFSFYHATGDLFSSEDILGMVFSLL